IEREKVPPAAACAAVSRTLVIAVNCEELTYLTHLSLCTAVILQPTQTAADVGNAVSRMRPRAGVESRDGRATNAFPGAGPPLPIAAIAERQPRAISSVATVAWPGDAADACGPTPLRTVDGRRPETKKKPQSALGGQRRGLVSRSKPRPDWPNLGE